MATQGRTGLVERARPLALRGLRLDVRWTGAEHVPRTGPVVLAATHVSYPDFVFIERAAVDPRALRAVHDPARRLGGAGRAVVHGPDAAHPGRTGRRRRTPTSVRAAQLEAG